MNYKETKFFIINYSFFVFDTIVISDLVRSEIDFIPNPVSFFMVCLK